MWIHQKFLLHYWDSLSPFRSKVIDHFQCSSQFEAPKICAIGLSEKKCILEKGHYCPGWTIRAELVLSFAPILGQVHLIEQSHVTNPFHSNNFVGFFRNINKLQNNLLNYILLQSIGAELPARLCWTFGCCKAFELVESKSCLSSFRYGFLVLLTKNLCSSTRGCGWE